MKHVEIEEISQAGIQDKLVDQFIRNGSAASETMLDFPCELFQIPQCQGLIAYRLLSDCAVVFGDPICPIDEISSLTEAFYSYCEKLNLHIIFIIVSEKFAKWVNNHFNSAMIQVCEELIFDPTCDPFAKSHRLRHRVNEALSHGLIVKEYLSDDKNIEDSIQQIGVQWQKARKGPQIYLGHLNFFENRTGKRWFYVEDNGKVTAMALLSKIEARDGWLLKFLITAPDAFRDTSELLMTTILKTLCQENCRFLTKGMVPSKSLGEIKGFGIFSTWLFRGFFKASIWFFKLGNRKEYWQRYHPKVEPSYLVFSHPHIGLNEIKALIKAFKID